MAENTCKCPCSFNARLSQHLARLCWVRLFAFCVKSIPYFTWEWHCAKLQWLQEVPVSGAFTQNPVWFLFHSWLDFPASILHLHPFPFLSGSQGDFNSSRLCQCLLICFRGQNHQHLPASHPGTRAKLTQNFWFSLLPKCSRYSLFSLDGALPTWKNTLRWFGVSPQGLTAISWETSAVIPVCKMYFTYPQALPKLCFDTTWSDLKWSPETPLNQENP